jgi:predicted ATP-dependent endonuclease of OLD family
MAVKTGLLSAANRKLEEISRLAWKQSDAALNLSVSGTMLTVLVRNEKDFDIQNQFSSYQSRSDGYKQFIALQVFTFLEKASKSILLIDEMEQHLHYDAQADLIQVLQDEKTVSNVVYTTHSAGSLPEDLGVGVRMARWVDSDKKRSEIVNKFWEDDNIGGFKPLLFGMGATTFAFFPSRRALIAEGPTEMLLLPTMLREVLHLEYLDFQIVHGLSNLSPTGLPMVDNDDSRICYIVDNDSGGRNLRVNLSAAGIGKKRVFSIGNVVKSAVTTEDIIEGSVWIEAVNRYIDMYGASRGVTEKITSAPVVGRIAALPSDIRKEKISFAYNVLELVREDPLRTVVAPRAAKKLRLLGQEIREALGLRL